MRLSCVVVCLFAAAPVASAQSAYVGASVFGDVVRVSHSSFGSDSGAGETLGGALRAGMPLGERWGVELEFARSGRFESSPDVGFAQVWAGIAPIDDMAIFPSPDLHMERQLSTISTLAWGSRDVSDRVSLVFLGGAVFTRTAVGLRLTYPEITPRLPIGGIVIPSPRVVVQDATTYDAGVAVGFEARIGMTEHVHMTPGLRLQTIPGGWAIRPGVGLQWTF